PATRRGRSATRSWLGPALSGGSPLTGYTVAASPGGATVTTDGSTTTAVVSGLANGTSYTFTVHATNSMGNSVESAPSNAVVPATTPGPPVNVTALAGNGSATVSWAAPSSTGGAPVTGYTVTASPGGSTVTTAANATSAVLALTNGTTYTFTVHAANSLG